MKTIYRYSILIMLTFMSCKSEKTPQSNHKKEVTPPVATKKEVEKKQEGNIIIHPIQHATAILETKDKIIYIDPTGSADMFKDYKKPNIVLITDVHGDHMDIETLDSLNLSKAEIIVPEAVAEKLPAAYTDQLIVINNGETKEIQGITIEAIPMYNLRKEALKFHPKGRGNGYIITLENKRIYFSGDTEDIPEMRQLKYIDMAFVCMNLPYTMTVESAADAVLEFKPKQVYPYHYRGTKGLSDVNKFKEIVATNPNIEVIQLDWYPSK